MSNSKVRGRRRRRERRFLRTDPTTHPWKFKLVRFLRNTRSTGVHIDWTPQAEALTLEQRYQVAFELFTSDKGEDVSNEVL